RRNTRTIRARPSFDSAGPPAERTQCPRSWRASMPDGRSPTASGSTFVRADGSIAEWIAHERAGSAPLFHVLTPRAKDGEVARRVAKRYDAVIIGGGHNGLVSAAYLARAGWSTLVLERRHVLGGAAVTEEIFPGFRFSVYSYVVSLLRPEIIRE